MRSWIEKLVVWVAFFCVGMCPCWAVTDFVTVSDEPLLLNKEMVSISDRTVSVDEVRAFPPEKWCILSADKDNLGFCEGEVWLRMRLSNADEQRTVQQFIEVPFARMDMLDWYLFKNGELVRKARSGSMLRQSEGTLDTRYPVFPFSIGPGETVEMYVHLASETVLHAGFRAWDAEAYAEAAQHREGHVALRMGTLLALLALAYLFVWGFREVGSVWFPMTFTCFGVGVASLAGYWPCVPWLSCHFRVKTLMLICSFWSIAFLLLHARHFYELKKLRPRLARWTLGVAVVSLVVGGISFWLPFRAGMRVAHIVVFMTFVVIAIIAVSMHARRVSWWLNIMAYLTFFGYIFTHLAFDLGLISLEVSADASGFAALSITVLLFLLAQVCRLRELQAGYVSAVLASQDERERRLADQRVMLRDLHDGLGGMAATVSLMAAYGKRSVDTTVKNERFEGIERMASYAGAEIRSLMNTLEKPAPYWADWLNDLRDYSAGVLEASQIDFDWECLGSHPEKWSGFAPALSLMRVVKEAVYNAVKHAASHRVMVRLVFDRETLEIRVRDNGTGFEHSPLARGKGLSNMEKRVNELGGQFNIHSTSSGTEVLITIKIPDRNQLDEPHLENR